MRSIRRRWRQSRTGHLDQPPSVSPIRCSAALPPNERLKGKIANPTQQAKFRRWSRKSLTPSFPDPSMVDHRQVMMAG
ncbi:hypothetical protein KCP76_00140 [Salmonella enterica subsp. enterica serovar Weltevreden]|nr:hypothetical protein KCP76_00140 [Salmonella enterica subsp. enterica serovar Weltevreden]